MLTRHGDPVSLVEVRRGSSRPPLYFPLGALGEIVLSEELVSELPADLPLYAFRDAIDDGPRAPSMEAMAGRLCADLTAFQAPGDLRYGSRPVRRRIAEPRGNARPPLPRERSALGGRGPDSLVELGDAGTPVALGQEARPVVGGASR